MQRFHQFVFAASLLVLSWLLMQAVHELGHVLGAIATGGNVTRIVLHPLAISRTDVSPNPHPAAVVWLGPLVGSLLPLGLAAAARKCPAPLPRILSFFAGFCLIANGTYISLGSFEGVGDCGEMLRTGTPPWAMHAFGLSAISLGLLIWHRLGSPAAFLKDPSQTTAPTAYSLMALLILTLIAAFLFSPR